MIRDRAFDVSELGMTYYLRMIDEGAPFIRAPRVREPLLPHSAIYINKNSGIARPQDLVGKTIGELALYGHAAGVMPKGHSDGRVRLPAREEPMAHRRHRFSDEPIDFVPLPHPADVDVTSAPDGADLGGHVGGGRDRRPHLGRRAEMRA